MRRNLTLAALAVALTACSPLYRALGGDYDPPGPAADLSAEARALLAAAADGIEPERFVDVHVHMIGDEVDPRAHTLRHPIRHGRMRVLLAAAGVAPDADWEAAYMERLLALIEASPLPGRHLLYALDRAYDREGNVDPARTSLYVANARVMAWAERHPDRLLPVISIHPHRADAAARLEYWAERGARFVKWLPNSQGMDPADPAFDDFYLAMARLGMTLLSHTGAERALPAAVQEYGNPLRLRRALDHGVRVIALHAAGDGTHLDLDAPGERSLGGWELLLRLLETPAYDGLLYADTSALTFRTHTPEPLMTLLARPELQRRFVHGSDYPLSGIRAAVSLRGLARAGFIERGQIAALVEIRDWNPLAFDWVLKRTLRHPDTGAGLTADVFTFDPFDWPSSGSGGILGPGSTRGH